MPHWTDEQQQAITTRGGCIVVSAAAGSGKTAVLVERVCHYLVHDIGDLDSLLVVTFTEAAAGEMRQRIAAALQGRLSVEPTNRHLGRQLALLPHAHISTIHSFCLWLLRRYFYRLDLDPSFRVMDEGEDRLLRLDVLKTMLEDRYQQETADSPFYALVDRYSDERGERLEQLILTLHDFAQSQVFPEAWLGDAAAAFDIPATDRLETLRWYDVVREHALAEVQGAKAALQAAHRLAELPAGPTHYAKPLLQDLTTVGELEGYLERGSWDQMVAAFADLAFMAARASRSRTATEIDENLLEQVKSLRDGAKKSLTKMRDDLFARSADLMLADLRVLAKPVSALVDLVKEFNNSYDAAKHARGVVNFSDLERLALQLLLDQASKPGNLSASVTALEVQKQFAEVLCDEYQDINPVQNTILSLVAGEYNQLPQGTPDTFLVGDVKQSIYRFRLAEPGIFLERCQQAKTGHGTPINLAANFRCRNTVVEGVNHIFRNLMTCEVGDVDYDAAAALIFRANYPSHADVEQPVEVVLLEGDPRLLDDARRSSSTQVQRQAANDDTILSSYTDNSSGDGGSGGSEGGGESAGEDSASLDADADELDFTALEREATWIARRINALVNAHSPSLVWDKEQGEYRPLCYRDIVVLLRATQVKSSQFVDIFQREGVPLYAETGSGYFRAPEIETILALLSIIDNPRQDLPLAGVLHSPLVGLKAAQLAEIRLVHKSGEYYDAVVTQAALDDALGAQLSAFLALLEQWRTQARRNTLAELVWSIYRETGYYDYCGGMPSGGQRQANLRALYDRARQFDQFARHGLLRFLQYISDLQAAGEDMGTAPTLGENEDVVRLMSIHKSKGLEFPIVFVAGLGTRFNQRDLYGTFLYDRKLGFGPQVIDPTTHIKAQTLASLGVRESIRRAGLSEEMRILYVALTRARERLYMVGTVPNLTETVGRWQEQAESVREQGKLPLYLAASAKRYMDWLGPVLCSQPKLVPNNINSDVVSAEVSGWRVSLYPPAAVVAELAIPTELGETRSKVSQTEIDSSDAVTLPSELRERLTQQIEWKYPWAAFGSITAKTTVTELKRRQKQIVDPENPVANPFRHASFRRPTFIVGESKLTATEVGTATHLVLQHLPLHEAVTPDLVTACIDDLINRDFLTAQEGAAVQSQAIVDFFDTPLGKRMITAASVPEQTLWREVPFSLAIAVEELSASVPTLPTEELLPSVHTADSGTIDIPDKGRNAVILQGVIDALFQGPAGWVLVDFKTDRLTGEDIESVALTRYAAQVRWYTKAAAQVMGVSITECYLVMLTHNQVVPVDFRSDLMDAM